MAGMLFGAVWFVAAHVALLFGVSVAILGLYCNLTTRDWGISQLLSLSFDSYFARLVDHAVLPLLFQIIAAEASLTMSTAVRIVLACLWSNAIVLIVANASVFLLLLRGLEHLCEWHDKKLVAEATGVEVKAEVATVDTVARLEKEIEQLKQMLTAPK